MVYLTYNILDPDTLELGDVLLEVNGSTDVMETLSAVACGDTATVLVRRDDTEQTFTITRHEQEDGSCTFGLSVRTFTDILSTDVDYTLHDSLTGGSSGGLLQALHIYNLLTPNDITGGLRIAGTGTIDVDGNVGAIGGVRQKIITSAMNGIDVFFVPHLSDAETDNYIVAQAVLETLETDMVLVPVTSFADATAYLASRFGGAFDE
jgi:PDZ domain-containing protein